MSVWRGVGAEGLLRSCFPMPLLTHILLTDPSDCWPLCPASADMSSLHPLVSSKHPMQRDKGYIVCAMGKAR